jgi:uncharacterized protein with FMN-binding domain
MKKVYKILLGFIGLIFFVIVISFFVLMNGMKEIETIKINKIDLLNIADGTYTGSFDVTRWSNTVEVKVANHEIIEIVVLDDVMIGLEGMSDRLFEKVIHNQSLDVDIETGTSITSKAYLKAIEIALGDE